MEIITFALQMTDVMKRLFISLVCLALLFSSCNNRGGMRFHKVGSFDEMLAVSAGDSARPVLLYVTTGSGRVDSVFAHEVFTDTALARFADEKLICARADVNEPGWEGFTEQYGLASLPSILLFAPDGELLMDIAHIGFLGRDEDGDLPCRKAMLRAMSLSCDCLNADDSTLFSAYNWKQIGMVTIRLDSRLFRRMINNKERLEKLYGNDFYLQTDYAMSSAAVNLVVERKGGNVCVPHRREAFYKAIDMLAEAGFPAVGDYYCTERYRFYGDINIATGLGRRGEAFRIIDEAFAKGVATETECNQLRYQLGQ